MPKATQYPDPQDSFKLGMSGLMYHLLLDNARHSIDVTNRAFGRLHDQYIQLRNIALIAGYALDDDGYWRVSDDKEAADETPSA